MNLYSSKYFMAVLLIFLQHDLTEANKFTGHEGLYSTNFYRSSQIFTGFVRGPVVFRIDCNHVHIALTYGPNAKKTLDQSGSRLHFHFTKVACLTWRSNKRPNSLIRSFQFFSANIHLAVTVYKRLKNKP